jgi:hypothetical protein
VTPWVLRLLIANVVIFFVQQTSPGLTQTLWFYPPQMLLKPWTLVTYMFLHGGFGHIFFNMITLAFIGPMVEERLGARRFLTLYVVSGIAGALLSSVLARGVPIVGASAAIYGVLLALARRAREGGSYHVRVSLCRSGMYIYNQGHVDYPKPDMGLSDAELESIMVVSKGGHGTLKHLGPVLRMSETRTYWDKPSPVLGSSRPEWLGQ